MQKTYKYENCSVAVLDNVVIVVVTGRWTLLEIQNWGKIIERVCSSSTTGYASLCVIADGASTLGPAEREALMHIASATGHSCRAGAVVIEGSGFGAAAKRTLATALNLFVHPPFPNKTFGTRIEAIDWLVAHLPANSDKGARIHGIEIYKAIGDLISSR